MLPGKSADETAAYALAPGVEIVENDAAAQAVTHSGLGIQAANFWTADGQPVAGISSDSIASVLVHLENGLLNVAVSDPTQANSGIVHLEIAAAGSAVLSKDAGITIDQIAPTVRLSVDVRGSQGKTFRVSLSAQ